MAESIQTQIGVAKGLYDALGKSSRLLGSLNTAFESQNTILIELTKSLNKATENLNRINEKMFSLNKKLEENIPKNVSEEIRRETKKLKSKSKKLDKEVSKALKEKSDKSNAGVLKSQKFSRKLFSGLSKRIQSAQTVIGKFSDAASNAKNSASKLEESTEDLSKELAKQEKSSGGLSLSSFNPWAWVGSFLLNIAKFFFKAVKTIIGAVFQLFKSIITLPFQVAKLASAAGNALRVDIIENIGNAYEESKNLFDATSNIGKAANNIRNYTVGSLTAMQSAHSKFTKMFGFGTQAGAAFQKFLHEAVNSMGHFAELFGPSVMSSGEAGFYLVEAMKTLGITNEQIGYYALEAATDTGNLNETLDNTRDAIESESKSSGLDFKMLSLNFHKLRTNIIDFGHLTSTSIAGVIEKATKMGVKVDELSGIFKKFTSFEDAATTSAKLFQSFGMGIDALQLLTANDPSEILQMMSDAMQATGKTFDSLNRHEKKLMQETTGMSAETLKSIMNYRAQGLTFEEARRKVQENDPTEEMTKTIKGLTSGIKEIQKVMQFDSPFQAFFQGLKMKALSTGSSIESLTGLSEAYDNLYHFGLTLDKNTFHSILAPVTMVIEKLHAIFTGESFLGTLSLGVRTVSDLFQNITRNFSGNKSSKALNDLYDKLAAVIYKKPGQEKALISLLNSQIGLTTFDKDVKEYLIKSGVVDSGTGKIIQGTAYSVVMQTLINASDKLPKSQNSITDIVKAVNTQFNSETVDSLGWSQLGFKGKIDRVKQGLRDLWKQSSPWAEPIFKLGGQIMGAIIKGFTVGLTAMFKVMAGDLDGFYQQTDSVLYKVMEKAAISQGKGQQFKNGKYTILDFVGLTSVYDEGIINRLGASITKILFSPYFYKLFGQLTWMIYDSIKPAIAGLRDSILITVTEILGKQNIVVRAAIKATNPELFSAGEAAKSKQPGVVAKRAETAMKKLNARVNKKSKEIQFDITALKTTQNELSTGEFESGIISKLMNWADTWSIASGITSITAGVGTYLGLSAATSYLGIGAAATVSAEAIAAGGTVLAMAEMAATSAGVFATAAAGTAAVVTAGAAIAVAGVAYLGYQWLWGNAEDQIPKRKKAIAQTEILNALEKKVLEQIKLKKIDKYLADKIKKRFYLAKSQISFDSDGIIDFEDAASYPAGYLYPAYSVSDKGMYAEINKKNYMTFGANKDNVQLLKDGMIRSVKGKGLVLISGNQKIIFDPNDTIELIASKKDGALLQYFRDINKSYDANIVAIKSRLFDESKKIEEKINKDIQEKRRISDVLEQTDKVINEIISYTKSSKKTAKKIKVQR